MFPAFLAAAVEVPTHGLGYLLGVLGTAIVLLLVMILALRLQAFIALIIASIFVAVAAGMPLGDIPDTIVKGMGGALGFIATIIGLGAIFGQILENSGGAKTLANSLGGFFGEKRASWAMLLTGFLISIPVFLDVGLVIVVPIVYALARDTKKSLLFFGLPLVAGMAVTHGFVPPTPGPVAVAEILGADLGRVILYGIAIGLPTAIIAGIFLCPLVCKNVSVEIPHFFEEAEESGPLPNFGLVAFMMGLSIVLIVRVAQGSATVAMITAAGLMAGIVEAGSYGPSDLALIVIAIAAGSTMLSHVNDSGFWIISRYLGMTEAQTLRTWTVISVAISLIGFALTLLLSSVL